VLDPQATIRLLHAELDQTNREVMALTLEFEQQVESLQAEIAERQRAEAERQAQLERLNLAYEELRRTQQAITQQERLRALGQMASGIAHDINNAITPISLYTDLLLANESGLSARGRGCLETISRAIGDVANTVARMREFYRPREAEAALQPVDLNEMARQVLDLTRARWFDMAQQRGVLIEVQTQLAQGLPSVAGLASEIREALTNLVFNAVDAMPSGGKLTLRTAAGAGEIRCEVSDTGVGMDEDTRRRCLEPFFTTKGERGTGLGLAMVYGVAQRHRAQVEIDSTPGQGTTMALVFPRAPAVAESQKLPEAPETPETRASGR